MIDSTFHKNTGSRTLADVCRIAGADAVGVSADVMADITIHDVAPVDCAERGHVAFVTTAKFAKTLATTNASAVLVKPELADSVPSGTVALVTDMPYRAYALVANAFYPKLVGNGTVHDHAVVHDTATIGNSVTIGAGAVIGAGATIGHHSVIGANAVVGDGVTIGQGCAIGANATLEYCLLGDDVQVLAGAVIGSRGFGFASDTLDYVDVPQLGRVIIGDHVEIGANATIDRGTITDTVIGNHVRIDNLVQVAHNCHMGDNSVMVAQTALAGSSILGKRVVLWGRAVVLQQATIGDDVEIMAQACVIKDVPSGAKVSGYPAYDHSDYMRNEATLRRLIKNYRKEKSQ